MRYKCWNIDGYKIKERNIIKDTYIGSKLQKSDTIHERYQMVHCDFGWGGSCNGYYVSGVFKLNDANIDHDYDNDSGKKTNYNHFVSIITYDLAPRTW